eukprot:3073252-Pyramimonas_sp.AAC.1
MLRLIDQLQIRIQRGGVDEPAVADPALRRRHRCCEQRLSVPGLRRLRLCGPATVRRPSAAGALSAGRKGCRPGCCMPTLSTKGRVGRGSGAESAGELRLAAWKSLS